MKNKFLFPCLLVSLLGSATGSAATFTFNATGTAVPSTSGVDPWGNPWTISTFGGSIHFGMPGIGTSPGFIPSWLCPDCILEVHVSAAITPGGTPPQPIAPSTILPQTLLNITDSSNYTAAIVGNTVKFTALPGGDIHIGDAVNMWTFFQSPVPPNVPYTVTVTYITDDACVPEPASLALIGSGLLLAGLVKRRSPHPAGR